jgi:hypothetical protein
MSIDAGRGGWGSGWDNQAVTLLLLTLTPSGGFAGIFGYSPAPGPGNLVFSLTAPGVTTDPFANPVKSGGFAVYGAGGAIAFLGVSGAEDILQFFSGSAAEKNPAGIFTALLGALPAQFIASAFEGPQITLAGHQDFVDLQLNSPAVDGSSFANGALNYIDTNGAQTTDAFWDATGFNINKGPGAVQTDVTQRNATTSATTQITPSYAIPAGIMTPGTSWELELFLAGNQSVTTATTLEFFFQVNGNNTAITLPAGFCTANGAFRGSARMVVSCKIPGPANTASIFINGEVKITQTTFAIANSNQFSVSSPNAQGPNASVDTTVAQFCAISVAWGTTGSLGGLYSRFQRLA